MSEVKEHQRATERPADPPRWEPEGRRETPAPIQLAERRRRLATMFLVLGIILSGVTVAVELSTQLCAGTLFDPLPTPWHALFAAWVPMSLVLVLLPRPDTERRLWLLRLGNGVALGVSIFYSLLFLPILPIAILAVAVGFGVFPLAPYVALIASLIARSRLAARARAAGPGAGRFRPTLVGALAILLIPMVTQAPRNLTTIGLNLAASTGTERAARGLELLRNYGDEEALLEYCYERPAASLDPLSVGLRAFGPPISSEQARPIYYQVTGRPFNAVPPPESYRDAWGMSPRFGWDRALGTDRVAARVLGLELAESRLDAIVEPQPAIAYWEWTLVFSNDTDFQREARGVVALPPGGVVSRLTLWVDGEEREAAFAGRTETREAYERVVFTRRDPVLVTTAGPDRVLVQCFPVPPHGEMRIRFGITAPLVLRGEDRGHLVPPYFQERNFSVGELEHSVWIEARGAALDAPAALQRELLDDGGTLVLRGGLGEDLLDDSTNSVVFERELAEPLAWAHALDGEGSIRQTFGRLPLQPPQRLAVVVDGSMSVGKHVEALLSFLEEIPEEQALALWVAGDRVHPLLQWDANSEARRRAFAELREFDFLGGRNSVPGMEDALDSVPLDEEVHLLWIHGPQPVLLSGTTVFEQYLERRRSPVQLTAVQVEGGPCELLEALQPALPLEVLPRVAGLEADLAALAQAWWGAGRPVMVRERLDAPLAAGISPSSSHLARLWAWDRARELGLSDSTMERERAVELAVAHQLVTPWTGAVVLETQEQYEDAGLEPVDPDSVPSVPEPGTWALLAVAALALFWVHRTRLRPQRA